MDAEIGLIGGSGIYDPALFEKTRKITKNTPFGKPSADLQVGELYGRKIAFLPRHGEKHTIPPHRVNYRANIWAMKELGVKRVISICAVGSLKEDYKPGQLVFTDQFIDLTKKRDNTFYEGEKVYHISCAEPFCPELRDLFTKKAEELKMPHHKQGTYICIEGPRFSTKAESHMFRQFADIIGMTLVPEAVLARELELCAVNVGMVTDYDVWKEHPVSAAEVHRVMTENLGHINRLLKEAIPAIPEERKCDCQHILKHAEL